MKWIVIVLIKLYQVLISPRKGFSCAHRMVHGGDSCSEAIKHIVLDKGVLSGFRDIQSRFAECKHAAVNHRAAHIPGGQKVLECGGVEACTEPLGGCGDLFDGGGGGGGDTGSSSSNTFVFISIGFFPLLLILGFFGWSYGQQVSTVQIRLLENVVEGSDKYIGKLLGGELPDYQVLLHSRGKKIKTNVLRNVSAKEWLVFYPAKSVEKSDVTTLSIVEKDVIGDKVLDTIDMSGSHGKGESFEFRIEKNWNLF